MQAREREDLHEKFSELAPVGDGTSGFTSQRCQPSDAILALQQKTMGSTSPALQKRKRFVAVASKRRSHALHKVVMVGHYRTYP